MTALVPAVFVILSALVASGYVLGRQRHRAILDELESRKPSPVPAEGLAKS